LRDRNRKAWLERVKKIIQRISDDPSLLIDDYFLETCVDNQIDVSWNWDGRLMRYRGWGLVQRKVERYCKTRTALDTVDWQTIVDIQKKLWREGVGLGMETDAWGPGGWGVTEDGKTRLGDLGCLVDDQELVAEMLSEPVRESRRIILMRLQPPETKQYVAEYLSFVSDHLNEETLSRTWRRDC
jgi:hypothetical protein